jgi:hypothetical protein
MRRRVHRQKPTFAEYSVGSASFGTPEERDNCEHQPK